MKSEILISVWKQKTNFNAEYMVTKFYFLVFLKLDNSEILLNLSKKRIQRLYIKIWKTAIFLKLYTNNLNWKHFAKVLPRVVFKSNKKVMFINLKAVIWS